MVDILKEFTRTYMAGFVLWIGAMVATLMFVGIEIPVLVQFKKNPAINPLPLILTGIVGSVIAWGVGVSIPYLILAAAGGAYLGYQADRYAARNIGKKVSWLSNKGFKKMLFKRSSSSSSTSTTRSNYSGPSSTNSSDFGGGTSSGGGGSSSW